jgi:hypothetical protein
VQQKSKQDEFASEAVLGSDSTVYSELELDNAVFSLDSTNSKDETPRTSSRSNSMVIESTDFLGEGPSNSPNDHDDRPTIAPRCLNLSTSIGGTRSKVEGGDRHDLEPEGVHKDTRHKIYTGSGSQSSIPYVLFGVVLRLALGVVPRRDCGCPPRYLALLYIVQGRVPSRLQGRSPDRITRNES